MKTRKLWIGFILVLCSNPLRNWTESTALICTFKIMKKELWKWTAEEKERILHDIQRLGVTVGCRKHNLSNHLYYTWLNRYNAHGLEGLEDRRGKDMDPQIKRLEKENKMLNSIDRNIILPRCCWQ